MGWVSKWIDDKNIPYCSILCILLNSTIYFVVKMPNELTFIINGTSKNGHPKDTLLQVTHSYLK